MNEAKVKHAGRQRVLQLQGKEVPLDLFLYSCLERERLVRATATTGAPVIKWALLTSVEAASEVADLPLSGLVMKLAHWYRTEFPDLSASKPLDHEQMVEVVPPIVGFNLDLADIYTRKTNEALPGFDASVGNNKFWDDVIKAVQELFPAYQHMFTRYIQWSHASEPTEIIDYASRPPVGRFAPPMPRDGRGGARGGPRGDRGGPRGGGREVSHRGPRSGSGPQREGKRSFEAKDYGARDSGGGRPPRRNDDRAPRRHANTSHDADQTAKLTEVVLAEVDEAITQLRKDPQLDEVTLKPQNSFYRRIQHQKAVESGYHSFSVGEGPGRAVKVARRDQ